MPKWATWVRRDSEYRVAGDTAASTNCCRLLEAGRGCSGPCTLGGSEDVRRSRRLVIQPTKRGATDDLELIEVE